MLPTINPSRKAMQKSRATLLKPPGLAAFCCSILYFTSYFIITVAVEVKPSFARIGVPVLPAASAA